MNSKTFTTKFFQLESFLLLSSIALTLFLAFIDEGNYNFGWMYDGGSWVALFIYGGVIFGIQYLIFRLILGKYEMVGIVASLLIMIVVVWLMIRLGT